VVEGAKIMYKQMQVYSGVKSTIQELKKELEFKNESEVVAYLAALREIQKNDITLVQHQKAIARRDEIINQSSL
jgi:hypothetical protein